MWEERRQLERGCFAFLVVDPVVDLSSRGAREYFVEGERIQDPTDEGSESSSAFSFCRDPRSAIEPCDRTETVSSVRFPTRSIFSGLLAAPWLTTRRAGVRGP